ncbi:MAG: hypothetical protein IJB15_02890 [Clostridia bacterium]|nr:hypothetical protein [Clostridia bacterium]
MNTSSTRRSILTMLETAIAAGTGLTPEQNAALTAELRRSAEELLAEIEEAEGLITELRPLAARLLEAAEEREVCNA